MDDTTRALFRLAYGRLCVLTAQALTDGYHRQAVLLASQGRSTAQDAKLRAISRQHARLHRVLIAARARGHETRDFVPVALEVKATVEGEWECSLPLVSEAPTSG